MINKRKEAANKQRESAKRARTSTKSLKSQYVAIKDSDVIVDLRSMGQKFINYYNKVAQDGIGSQDKEGKVVVTLTPQERISYLDQSKGIQAMLDYIERMITPEPPTTQTPPVA